jgi:hypothetical protein
MFLQYIKYIIFEFTPSTTLLLCPPHTHTHTHTHTHFWNTSNKYHFCIYIYVNTLFALYSSSYSFPLPTSAHPRAESVPPSCSLIFQKKKQKIKRETCHFCCFEIKIATQGVSLCCFHAYIYYNQNWFISSSLLLSSLVPIL